MTRSIVDEIFSHVPCSMIRHLKKKKKNLTKMSINGKNLVLTSKLNIPCRATDIKEEEAKKFTLFCSKKYGAT